MLVTQGVGWNHFHTWSSSSGWQFEEVKTDLQDKTNSELQKSTFYTCGLMFVEWQNWYNLEQIPLLNCTYIILKIINVFIFFKKKKVL